MRLSKRTLSDGELFAQSKNRHESNHLKMRLDEIKIQEIQSTEQNRLEKYKWREFLRANSRNSGNSTLASSHDYRGEESDSETPRTSRNFCDLQTVQQYQRQWVVAYHPHSYNKVYNEIEQAGFSLHRTMKSPRPAQSFSGSSSSSGGDSAGMYRCATAAMGVKRVRNSWESKRPKTSTSSTDYRHAETIIEINLNKDQRNYVAPWLRKEELGSKVAPLQPITKEDLGSKVVPLQPPITKEELSSKVVPLQQITSNMNSLTDVNSSNDQSTTPQETTSDILLQNVSSMQAVTRSRLRWRCSICGQDKVAGEAEDRFAYTVLVYKDLNKILNNTQTKPTSSLQQTEVARLEPQEPVSSPRIECSCRGTNTVVDNSEIKVSLDIGLSNHASTRAYRKSSTLSTHGSQSRVNRRKSSFRDNPGPGLNTEAGDGTSGNNNIVIHLNNEGINKDTTSPTSTLNSMVSTLTSAIDNSEEDIKDDTMVQTDNSVSNPNNHTDVREHIAKDSCGDSRSNTIMLITESNMISPEYNHGNQPLTSTETNENKDTNVDSNNTASSLKEDTNIDYKITLETQHDQQTCALKEISQTCTLNEISQTRALNETSDNELIVVPHEKPINDSKRPSSQQVTRVLSVSSVENTRHSSKINKESNNNKMSIDLRAGEQFFKQVAQTMKLKQAEKRSKETWAVTAGNRIPRMKKHCNVRGTEANDFFTKSYVPSFHNIKIAGGIGSSHNIDGDTEIAKELHLHGAISEENSEKTSQGNVEKDLLNHHQAYHADMVESKDNLPDKTSANKTVSQIKHLDDKSDSGMIHGMNPNQSARMSSNTPTQRDHETLLSASSKKETIRSYSARPYRSKENYPLKQHVEFRGVIIRDYIAPHLRYKTAASDRLKRPLSVKWHSSGGVEVTVHEKSSKSRLIDIVFPKQARQKQLLKMIEENHKKVPNTATFTADAELRRRIDTFLKSVEHLCRR